MNWVDYAILGVVLISAFISLVRGFVREALSLTGWIAAIWISLTFAGGLSGFFDSSIEDPTLRLIVAFAVLFVVTLIMSAVVNFFAAQLVQRTGLSGTDRFIGMVFGLLRGVLLIAILVLVAGMTTMPQSYWWKGSVFLDQFQALALWLRDFLPTSIVDNLKF